MSNRVFKSNELLDFNMVNFMSDTKEEYNNKLLTNIKNKLEQLDKQIMNEGWRLKNGYICNSLVQRTILTQEGPVTFQRMKYKYVGEDGKWHYKCLLDDYIQLAP